MLLNFCEMTVYGTFFRKKILRIALWYNYTDFTHFTTSFAVLIVEDGTTADNGPVG